MKLCLNVRILDAILQLTRELYTFACAPFWLKIKAEKYLSPEQKKEKERKKLEEQRRLAAKVCSHEKYGFVFKLLLLFTHFSNTFIYKIGIYDYYWRYFISFKNYFPKLKKILLCQVDTW